jgi:hypothetical protein
VGQAGDSAGLPRWRLQTCRKWTKALCSGFLTNVFVGIDPFAQAAFFAASCYLVEKYIYS